MKPLPILSHMPLHVKEKIGSRLELFDRLSLRKTNKDFQSVIGDPEVKFRDLWLNISGNQSIELSFTKEEDKDIKRVYTQENNDCKVIVTSRFAYYCMMGSNDNDKLRAMKFKDTSYIDLALRDFDVIVDNPNFSVDYFNITAQESYGNSDSIRKCKTERDAFLFGVQKILKNLKEKMKVKRFMMRYTGDQEEVLHVLPHLDSTALDSLSLHLTRACRENVGVDKIIELEQFKSVKELGMFDLPDNKFPIEMWWNYPSTTMDLYYTKLKDLKRLFKHFRTMESFVDCNISTNANHHKHDLKIGKAFAKNLDWEPLDDYQYGVAEKTPTKFHRVIFVRDGSVRILAKEDGMDDYYLNYEVPDVEEESDDDEDGDMAIEDLIFESDDEYSHSGDEYSDSDRSSDEKSESEEEEDAEVEGNVGEHPGIEESGEPETKKRKFREN